MIPLITVSKKFVDDLCCPAVTLDYINQDAIVVVNEKRTHFSKDLTYWLYPPVTSDILVDTASSPEYQSIGLCPTDLSLMICYNDYTGYYELFKQWKILFEEGKLNNDNGRSYISAVNDTFRFIRREGTNIRNTIPADLALYFENLKNASNTTQTTPAEERRITV